MKKPIVIALVSFAAGIACAALVGRETKPPRPATVESVVPRDGFVVERPDTRLRPISVRVGTELRHFGPPVTGGEKVVSLSFELDGIGGQLLYGFRDED